MRKGAVTNWSARMTTILPDDRYLSTLVTRWCPCASPVTDGDLRRDPRARPVGGPGALARDRRDGNSGEHRRRRGRLRRAAAVVGGAGAQQRVLQRGRQRRRRQPADAWLRPDLASAPAGGPRHVQRRY